MIAPAPAKTSANVPIDSARRARALAAAVEVDERRRAARTPSASIEKKLHLPRSSRSSEARLDELAQVVRDRRLREPERLDELADAHRLAARSRAG